MIAIILCAGRGLRTGLKYPKCLHKLDDGSTLIDQNIKNLKKCGFKDSQIILGTGYAEKLIKEKTFNKFKCIKNKKYKSTNMLYTFNEVLNKIKSKDTYIFYADIFYDYNILKKLILSKRDIVTLVDNDWLKKWKFKKNYHDDFESLVIKKNKVIELGEKTKNLNKVHGRYVGISKFSKKIISILKKNKVIQKEIKKNKKLDFTSFLMSLINKKYLVYSLESNIKWFEFDTKYDFDIFKKHKKKIIGYSNN